MFLSREATLQFKMYVHQFVSDRQLLIGENMIIFGCYSTWRSNFCCRFILLKTIYSIKYFSVSLSAMQHEAFLFLEETLFHQFLVAKLLYKSKCLSKCPSTTFRGNVIFSAPNWDIAPIFLCADSTHEWASIL